jgi:hypothetical protein
MGIELGRISGPLLASNLVRKNSGAGEENLAFDTDLLYLDVINGRVGINTDTPYRNLQVNGTMRTGTLLVPTESDITNFVITTDQIQNLLSSITISPNQGGTPTIITDNIKVDYVGLKSTNQTIYNNTLDSNININPVGTGKVNVTANVLVNGDVHATGNITWDGDVVIGDSSTDKVQFLGDVNSNIVPNYNNQYNLGSPSLRWKSVYSNNLNGSFDFPNILFSGNTISAKITDSDLVFLGNSNGGVTLDTRLKITDNVISNVWSSALTDAQKSIIISPNGMGNTVINSTKSLQIPVGNNSTRTLASAGEIRYNNIKNLYEGAAGTGLLSFNGLYDSDKNTYITPGSTDNTIYFGTNNVVKTTLDSTSLNSNIFEAGNIRLTANTVSNTVSGNDLTFAPNGDGNTVLNGLVIRQNYIVNSLDSSLNLNTTGDGYVKFSGTGGLVVPTGLDNQRRVTPELGELRYNTQAAGTLEIFDGTRWLSAVGNNATISESDVIGILDIWTLILG